MKSKESMFKLILLLSQNLSVSSLKEAEQYLVDIQDDLNILEIMKDRCKFQGIYSSEVTSNYDELVNKECDITMTVFNEDDNFERVKEFLIHD